MRAAWCAVAVGNLTWCAVLLRHRRDNHPWLLPFFLLYTLTDVLMLAWSPTRLDGFALLGPTNGPWWVFVAALAWLLWFVAPPLAAIRLWTGRAPWWTAALLMLGAVALSASEILGASVALRRGLMHIVFEPLCLIAALIIMWRYVSNVVNKGLEKGIDYLAFAVQITAMMLLLKIGLILKDGILVKWMAYIFHGIYMFAAVGYYVFRRRYLMPWLLYHS
jgi:hypothetical protein